MFVGVMKVPRFEGRTTTCDVDVRTGWEGGAPSKTSARDLENLAENLKVLRKYRNDIVQSN